jgi:hypothetical protein
VVRRTRSIVGAGCDGVGAKIVGAGGVIVVFAVVLHLACGDEDNRERPRRTSLEAQLTIT